MNDIKIKSLQRLWKHIEPPIRLEENRKENQDGAIGKKTKTMVCHFWGSRLGPDAFESDNETTAKQNMTSPK